MACCALLIGLSLSRFLPFRGCFGQALFSPFFAYGFQNGAKFFSPHGFPRFLGFDSKTVQRSAFCRSRRELSSSLSTCFSYVPSIIFSFFNPWRIFSSMSPSSQSSFQTDPNSNAYLLAKCGFDTAENEAFKVR